MAAAWIPSPGPGLVAGCFSFADLCMLACMVYGPVSGSLFLSLGYAGILKNFFLVPSLGFGTLLLMLVLALWVGASSVSACCFQPVFC